MSNPKLSLEILNGPLDGYMLILENETIWGKEGEGPLIFLWDTELGKKQARFFPEGDNWRVETCDAPHRIYCLNRQQHIEGKIQLEKGDLLKASNTWLLVNKIE